MDRIQISFIKDALDHPHLLTEWEVGFIDNIAEYENDHKLTKKQVKRLNEIGHKLALG